MGLIKVAAEVIGAAKGALSTTANAVWLDYFESGAMTDGILMKRAERIVGEKSRNTKGDLNIINSGAGIDVQENQCMFIVENGRVVEFCAEPGRYTFDDSLAPSLLAGENKGLRAVAGELAQQVLAGGQRTNTQRVYYVNLGEIQGFKWGSGNISFQHVERDLASDRPVWQCSTTLQGNGVYSIHIVDPMQFFKNLGAATTGTDGDGVISAADIDMQIKTEVIGAIRQGIGGLSSLKIPYTDIAGHEAELITEVNKALSDSWSQSRGMEIFKIAIGMLDPDAVSKKKIGDYQETKGYTDPSMLAAYMGVGQTEAMKAAGANSAGAVQGFAGLGMMGTAAGTGNANLADMMALGQQQKAAMAASEAAVPPAAEPPAASVANSQTWTCACGTQNQGKFCTECGKPAPVVKMKYKCNKCGWEPTDASNLPRFCPNCGDPFNEEDVVNNP
ncbi:MAG: SPFH domain-containing protein [Lachnospiraceae bacterium]